MKLISRKQELIDNINTFEGYLNSNAEVQMQFAQKLMFESKTFCVYKLNGENHFAPSHFLCYANNTSDDHFTYEEQNDRDTNKVITKVLGQPFSHDMIDERFKVYAKTNGLEIAASKRNYWRVKDDRGKNLDIKL